VPVEIRRATAADSAAMRRLWDELTAEATFTPYPATPFDPALLVEHVALLAEEHGDLVGTVYANLSSAGFGFVFGLYTRPAARRRGVATALMRAVADALHEAGRRHLVLTVETPNEQARAFYDRLGFEDAARMLRIEVDRLREP
jgi:ribosomal protein S18 acetylase RimI-like enzyme